MTHDCPFTLGQLMALYALAKVHSTPQLAAAVLDHARQHETTEEVTV
jgi:hypothetical protein